MGKSGRSQKEAGPHNPDMWSGEVTEEGGRWPGGSEKSHDPAIRKRGGGEGLWEESSS